MPIYDKAGNWVSAVQPKGEKKAKKSDKKAVKVVKPNEDADTKDDVTARNAKNRNFGKSVERTVATLTGGSRVPASGAIKTSAFNLVGDVQVRYDEGTRTICLVECKGTSGINPSGEKTFVLKKSVLDQCSKEADLLGAVGATWVHWKNANYVQDDYVVLSAKHFLELLEIAKSAGLEVR